MNCYFCHEPFKDLILSHQSYCDKHAHSIYHAYFDYKNELTLHQISFLHNNNGRRFLFYFYVKKNMLNIFAENPTEYALIYDGPCLPNFSLDDCDPLLARLENLKAFL